jgi:hypothetical protein
MIWDDNLPVQELNPGWQNPQVIMLKKGDFSPTNTELCFFCHPDSSTHDDAENPPHHEIGTNKNNEK